MRLEYIPLALMLSIASFQLITSEFGVLSKWKGGGFGMFSTIESPGSRKVVVKGRFVETQEPVTLSVKHPRLNRAYKRLRTYPTIEKMEKLATQILQKRWQAPTFTKNTNPKWKVASSGQGQTPKSLDIFVYQIHLNNGADVSIEERLHASFDQ